MVQFTNVLMTALLSASASSALFMQKRTGQTIIDPISTRNTLASSVTPIGLRNSIASRNAIDESWDVTTPPYGTDALPPSSLSDTTIDDSVLPPGGSGDPLNGDPIDEPLDCDESVPSQPPIGDTSIPPITNTPDSQPFEQLGGLFGDGTGTGNNGNTPAIPSSLTHANLPGIFSSLPGNGTDPSNSSSPSISLQFTTEEFTELLDTLRFLFSIENGTHPSSESVDNSNSAVSFSSLIHSTNDNTATAMTMTTTPPPEQPFLPGSILRRYRAAASNANNAKSKRVQSEFQSKRAEVLSGQAKFKSRRAEEFELGEVKPGYAAAKPSRRRSTSKPLNAKR